MENIIGKNLEELMSNALREKPELRTHTRTRQQVMVPWAIRALSTKSFESDACVTGI